MFERAKAAKYVNEINALAKSSAMEICSIGAVAANLAVCPDRDFAAFELAFYYFFLYDYRVLHKLPRKVREAAADVFLQRLAGDREKTFATEGLDEYFDNRIQAYFRFMKEAKTVGEFLANSADYINVLVTISIEQNGYARGRLEDMPQMRESTSPNLYTESIRYTLALTSTTLL